MQLEQKALGPSNRTRIVEIFIGVGHGVLLIGAIVFVPQVASYIVAVSVVAVIAAYLSRRLVSPASWLILVTFLLVWPILSLTHGLRGIGSLVSVPLASMAMTGALANPSGEWSKRQRYLGVILIVLGQIEFGLSIVLLQFLLSLGSMH